MTTVFQDTFTESSTTLLSAHTAEIGGGWQQAPWATSATISVVGGAGYATGSSGSSSSQYRGTTAISSADCKVRLDFAIYTSLTASRAGLLARVGSGATKTCYQVYFNGNDNLLYVERIVNGTSTVLVTKSKSMTLGAAYYLEAEFIGARIIVSVNGTVEIDHTDPSPITAAGAVGIIGRNVDRFDSLVVTTADAPDTTPPTLTSPTATATGPTSASGTVSTNEATGSLFYLASTNASEGVATVTAASSQAVSATGLQSVTFSGLTASTTYYAHYVHRDAAGNDSTVASSASFTTSAAGDTTLPTLTGSITISALTTTSYTASWPAGSDNVAVTGYEYRIAAGSWVDAGNVLTVNITGRTPGATETFEVRAYDAAGNRSTPAISTSVTLNSAASITTSALRNNTATVHASTAVHWTWLPAGRVGSLAAVTPQDGTGTTNASGQLTVSGLTAPGILIVAKRNTGATDDDVYYEAFS